MGRGGGGRRLSASRTGGRPLSRACAHACAVAVVLVVAAAAADQTGGRTWTFEDDVNFYHVVSGRRRQVTGWNGRVTGNAWHELGVDAAGDHFEVSWDGKKVVDAHDRTFTESGKVGLWTKADSITEFDDLTVAEGGTKP